MIPPNRSTPFIIDTHAHLCDPSFDADRQDVLSRACAKGVNTVIAVGESLGDAKKNLKLAEIHPEIRPAAGLYPTRLDLKEADAMEALIRSERDRLIAIGEVGLDFWAIKDNDQKQLQREIFARFIDLATELELPLNVHSRSAGRHAITMLIEQGARRVQLHAFDGKFGTAIPAIEAGYFFSIPPSVIRSRQKQKLVKHLPLSCLLLESDSPVLGPDPKTRNEPANIIAAEKSIAEIKQISTETVLEAAYENTLRLYGEKRLRPALCRA